MSDEMDIYKKLERFRKIFILSISVVDIAIVWCGIYMNEVVLASACVISLVVITQFCNEMLWQTCNHKLTFKRDDYFEGIALTVVAAMTTLLSCLICFLGINAAYYGEPVSKWAMTGSFVFMILLLCFVNLNNMLQELILNTKKTK